MLKIQLFKIVTSITLFCLLGSNLFADNKDDSFWRGFKVRKSAYEKSQFSKPGQMQFTSPDDSNDSYAIDIGVTYTALATNRFVFGPKVEYHKNTLIDKEQDLFRAGLVGSYMFGEVISNNSDGLTIESFAMWSDLSIDYKNDIESKKKSLETSLLFTPLYTPYGLGNAGFGTHLTRFGFDLSFGLEYENGKSEDLNETGDTIRSVGKLGIVVYPLFGVKAIGRNLQLIAYGTIWQEIYHTGLFNNGQDFFRLYNFGITYYFNHDQTIGFSLNRVQGDDPSQNLQDQKYTEFGIVFKIGQ